jgi:hypothetical protein
MINRAVKAPHAIARVGKLPIVREYLSEHFILNQLFPEMVYKTIVTA